MDIKTLLEDYETNYNELIADLCMLRDLLYQDMEDPDGSISSIQTMLSRLRCCAEFTNNIMVDGRLFHAEEKFNEITITNWAIQSRPNRQKAILQGLYIEKRSWMELATELCISQTTLARERQIAIREIQREIDTWPQAECKCL